MIDVGDKTYVVERFSDDRLVSERGSVYRLVAARDVTRVKAGCTRTSASRSRSCSSRASS